MKPEHPVPESVFEARERVLEAFPDADVEVTMEVLVTTSIDPAIRVKADMETMDEYTEKKERLREIAREVEEGGDMIYTSLDRRHSQSASFEEGGTE